jgi:hypothetical protein
MVLSLSIVISPQMLDHVEISVGSMPRLVIKSNGPITFMGFDVCIAGGQATARFYILVLTGAQSRVRGRLVKLGEPHAMNMLPRGAAIESADGTDEITKPAVFVYCA